MNGKDLSIIVQGQIDQKITPLCVKSFRQSLPEAEIILSTWRGADVANIEADQIILNDDPGGLVYDKCYDNTNRQILSTINGLRKATRNYSLKVRTDSYISKNISVDEQFIKYPKRKTEYSVFSERIITSTLFTKRFLDTYSKIPTPFHVSDWFQLGLTSDLNFLWDIPLISDQNYLVTNLGMEKIYKGLWVNARLVPEQYIFLMAVKKRFGFIGFDNIINFNSKIIEFSNSLIANNFIVVPPKKLGYTILKEPYRFQVENYEKFIDDAYIDENVFDDFYKKYCC